MIYALVEGRRLQWDNLLWQVPVLGFTAQAFLFSIALSPDTTSLARVIVMTLSVVITFLSMTLMARHRQAELTDSHWLERYEAEWDEADKQHGRAWRERRNEGKTDSGVLDKIIPLLPGYLTWQIGLALFGATALAVVVITFAAPSLLAR